LVAKVGRKQLALGEGWEEVMRLAFMVRGDKKRSQENAAETVWRDPEYRTEGEHIDAVVKLRALGVPLEVLWQKAGFTAQEIARFKDQLREERDWALPPSVNAAAKDEQIATGTTPADPDALTRESARQPAE
jgi:hypothetical protein